MTYRKTFSDEQIRLAWSFYERGETADQAAARIGMSGSWWRERAIQLGYKLRSASEYPESSPRGEDHYAWKGEQANRDAKRNRAQRAFSLDGVVCERCQEKPATDRHHRDDDVGNNFRDNLMFLCRRCHMEIDGRLGRNLDGGRKPKPPKPCAQCSRLFKPLRRGLCSRCDSRKRRAAQKEIR